MRSCHQHSAVYLKVVIAEVKLCRSHKLVFTLSYCRKTCPRGVNECKRTEPPGDQNLQDLRSSRAQIKLSLLEVWHEPLGYTKMQGRLPVLPCDLLHYRHTDLLVLCPSVGCGNAHWHHATSCPSYATVRFEHLECSPRSYKSRRAAHAGTSERSNSRSRYLHSPSVCAYRYSYNIY